LIGRLLRATFVFLLGAPISYSIRCVGGFGQPVGEVEQILGDSDRAEELIAEGSVLHVIVVVIHEELFSHTNHCGVLQDLLAGGSQLGLDLDQRFGYFGKIR